jgi:hypothetical protein
MSKTRGVGAKAGMHAREWTPESRISNRKPAGRAGQGAQEHPGRALLFTLDGTFSIESARGKATAINVPLSRLGLSDRA